MWAVGARENDAIAGASERCCCGVFVWRRASRKQRGWVNRPVQSEGGEVVRVTDRDVLLMPLSARTTGLTAADIFGCLDIDRPTRRVTDRNGSHCLFVHLRSANIPPEATGMIFEGMEQEPAGWVELIRSGAVAPDRACRGTAMEGARGQGWGAGVGASVGEGAGGDWGGEGHRSSGVITGEAGGEGSKNGAAKNATSDAAGGNPAAAAPGLARPPLERLLGIARHHRVRLHAPPAQINPAFPVRCPALTVLLVPPSLACTSLLRGRRGGAALVRPISGTL